MSQRSSKRYDPTDYGLIHYEDQEGDLAEEEYINEQAKDLPQWLLFAGGAELYGKSLYKSCVIEFVGATCQSFLHIAIVAAAKHYVYPPAQGGMITAFIVCLYIFQFAMCSGAHFNSLITMAALSTAHLPIVRGLMYIAIQVVGWYVGAVLMRSVLDRDEALAIGLGSCSGGTKTYEQMFVLEFMCCIIYLFSVYGTAFNPRQGEIFGQILPPILIGMTLGTLIYLSNSLGGAGFTGAGLNPSLCSGTNLAYVQIPGVDYDKVFKHHSVYWLAPILSCAVSSFLYNLVPPFHDVIEKEKKIEQQQLQRKMSFDVEQPYLDLAENMKDGDPMERKLLKPPLVNTPSRTNSFRSTPPSRNNSIQVHPDGTKVIRSPSQRGQPLSRQGSRIIVVSNSNLNNSNSNSPSRNTSFSAPKSVPSRKGSFSQAIMNAMSAFNNEENGSNHGEGNFTPNNGNNGGARNRYMPFPTDSPNTPSGQKIYNPIQKDSDRKEKEKEKNVDARLQRLVSEPLPTFTMPFGDDRSVDDVEEIH
jgi:glycerol uptake facilitator-like aquaporin